MASKLEICNNALNKVGAEKIDSLTDNNKRARTVSAQYDITRRKLLRNTIWNFAVKRVILTPSTEELLYGSGYQYELPTDCLKIWKIENYNGEYKKEGRFLIIEDPIISSSYPAGFSYTHSNPTRDSEDYSIFLKYIHDITDVSKFDSTFYDIFALILARDIAYRLTQDKNLSQLLSQQVELELRDARSFDGQEGTPDTVEPDYFLQSRRTFFTS
jgi:hypothetical protein